MSASTHIPPTGTHCPAATLAAIRSNSSGSRWRTHSYCWACEQENTKSGSSSIRATAEANVRTHLRTVSRIGHSHAVSMWAWPVAMARWADGAVGVASAGARTARASAGVAPAATASSPRASSAQQLRPPAVGDGQRAHHAVEDVEVVEQRLGLLVDDDEVGAGELVERGLARRRRRTERRRPELRERRVRGCLDDDLHRTGAGGDRHGRAPRVDALDRLAVRPTHEALALESGTVGGEAEIDDRLDALRRPLGGHFAPAAEPRRAPRRPPWRGHRESVAERRATGPASTLIASRRGWTSGRTRSNSSRSMRSSTSGRLSCTAENGSDTEISLTDTMSHALAGPPPTFGQLAMRHRLTLVVAGAGWGKSAMLRGLTATAPSIEVRRPASGWTPFALAHALVDGIAEHTHQAP